MTQIKTPQAMVAAFAHSTLSAGLAILVMRLYLSYSLKGNEGLGALPTGILGFSYGAAAGLAIYILSYVAATLYYSKDKNQNTTKIINKTYAIWFAPSLLLAIILFGLGLKFI